jgi:hypothetical protein
MPCNVLSALSKNRLVITKGTVRTFPPKEYDVVCGRGKGSYNLPGNKRFRFSVRRHIPRYLAAKGKLDKGIVLNAIMNDIQNRGSRFLKPIQGAWYALSDEQAREKVGHTIRESIAALEGLPDRETTKKVFDRKQNDLLAQQRAIFDYMLRNKD